MNKNMVMKYFYLAAICFFVHTSCDNKECCDKPPVKDCPENYTCTFKVSTIGDTNTFVYTSTFNDNPNIIDDEQALTLTFKVPAQNSSFKYEGEQLVPLETDINYQCGECCNAGSFAVTKGSIEGTKMSNGNWELIIHVYAEWDCSSQKGNHEVHIQEIFTP